MIRINGSMKCRSDIVAFYGMHVCGSVSLTTRHCQFEETDRIKYDGLLSGLWNSTVWQKIYVRALWLDVILMRYIGLDMWIFSLHKQSGCVQCVYSLQYSSVQATHTTRIVVAAADVANSDVIAWTSRYVFTSLDASRVKCAKHAFALSQTWKNSRHFPQIRS